VQFQLQRPAIDKKESGLTLIEVLVSLALLGVIVFIMQGFVIPIKVTKQSSIESNALNFAKSYIELVKVNWLQSSLYGPSLATVNADTTFTYWPEWGTTGSPALKLPTNWTITATATSANTTSASNAKFTTAKLISLQDTLRLVTVTVTPPTDFGSKPVVLTTLIARPSTGIIP
jgi:prepilin-type N-terminal cleavage/methylation domain-containing protein